MDPWTIVSVVGSALMSFFVFCGAMVKIIVPMWLKKVDQRSDELIQIHKDNAAALKVLSTELPKVIHELKESNVQAENRISVQIRDSRDAILSAVQKSQFQELQDELKELKEEIGPLSKTGKVDKKQKIPAGSVSCSTTG